MRFPLTALAVFIAGLTPQTWTLPHYFAPATALLYLVLLQCMRHMRLWKGRHSAQGPAAVRMVVMVCCAMFILRVAAAITHTAIEPAWPRGNLERANILRRLRHRPGLHLVIVRYGPHADPTLDWIHNDADIDAAKVVWARDMGGGDNQELLSYFKDRRVWQVSGDALPSQLEVYEAATK
jgi:hypothetical protein